MRMGEDDGGVDGGRIGCVNERFESAFRAA
jgi:hypothetical protein